MEYTAKDIKRLFSISSQGWALILDNPPLRERLHRKFSDFLAKIAETEEQRELRTKIEENFKEFNLRFDYTWMPPFSDSCAWCYGIIVSETWMECLMSHPKDYKLWLAFLISINHEIAHLETLIVWNESTHNSPLMRMVNEVYADLRAVQRLGITGQEAVEAKQYEMEVLSEDKCRAYIAPTDGIHPRIDDRLRWMYGGKFDADVIRDIANTYGYQDDIQTVATLFRPYYFDINSPD